MWEDWKRVSPRVSTQCVQECGNRALWMFNSCPTACPWWRLKAGEKIHTPHLHILTSAHMYLVQCPSFPFVSSFSPSVFVRPRLKEIKRLCVCVFLLMNSGGGSCWWRPSSERQDVKECGGGGSGSLYEHHRHLNHTSCILVHNENKRLFPACFQSWGTAGRLGEGGGEGRGDSFRKD